MERIQISKNIYLYRFGEALGHFIGLNVVLIVNGNEGLLLDTGYEDNFLELKKDLDKRNITITDVVVSHFHPDHTGGLKYLSKANIYGSEFAEYSLLKFNKEIDHLLPTTMVFDKLEFNFGNHIIKLEKNIGHSKDGILTTIDDKFMYVGDDMVYSHNGKALIPFCADQIVENHILSIEKIYKNYEGKIIIPTHGEIIENQEIIKKDLENRLTYLKYIQDNPDCSFEEFSKDTGIKFIGMKSHVYNTKKEVKKW
jgi:glyoxylase-like metal-dependent hydrolase (beta-lactamase superfamily II)